MFAALAACDSVEMETIQVPNEFMDMVKEISVELLDVFRLIRCHLTS